MLWFEACHHNHFFFFWDEGNKVGNQGFKGIPIFLDFLTLLSIIRDKFSMYLDEICKTPARLGHSPYQNLTLVKNPLRYYLTHRFQFWLCYQREYV